VKEVTFNIIQKIVKAFEEVNAPSREERDLFEYNIFRKYGMNFKRGKDLTETQQYFNRLYRRVDTQKRRKKRPEEKLVTIVLYKNGRLEVPASKQEVITIKHEIPRDIPSTSIPKLELPNIVIPESDCLFRMSIVEEEPKPSLSSRQNLIYLWENNTTDKDISLLVQDET